MEIGKANETQRKTKNQKNFKRCRSFKSLTPVRNFLTNVVTLLLQDERV